MIEKYPKILRLEPGKFEELLKAYDLDSKTNTITIFTKNKYLPKNVAAIYIKKSAIEVAFEDFLKTEQKF